MMTENTELKIVTTNELKALRGVSSAIVKKNVQSGKWRPIHSLGLRPYRFDLDQIDAQIKSEGLHSSLKIESRHNSNISSSKSLKKKGAKRDLWQK